MKQHSMRNESSPVTNISVTNNYNTTSGVSTERKDEENENKDEELKKYLIKIENEYQEKLVQGKKIYKMLGEGVVSYQALPREMKEDVDLYIITSHLSAANITFHFLVSSHCSLY